MDLSIGYTSIPGFPFWLPGSSSVYSPYTSLEAAGSCLVRSACRRYRAARGRKVIFQEPHRTATTPVSWHDPWQSGRSNPNRPVMSRNASGPLLLQPSSPVLHHGKGFGVRALFDRNFDQEARAVGRNVVERAAAADQPSEQSTH